MVLLKLKLLRHLAIEITRFDTFFFLPRFFSFCESYAYLDEISFAIDLYWDDRCSHFFYLRLEAYYLTFFEEDFAITFWWDDP